MSKNEAKLDEESFGNIGFPWKRSTFPKEIAIHRSSMTVLYVNGVFCAKFLVGSNPTRTARDQNGARWWHIRR